jgi:hypothetical protein
MAALLPIDMPAPAPQTAFGQARSHLRARLRRTLLFMAALCTGIALLTTALDGFGFHIKLLYSFCIGLCCLLLMDGGRLAVAALADLQRRLRGLPPAPNGFASGWHGVVLAAPVATLAGPVLGVALADLLTGFESPSLLQFSSSNTRVTLVLALLGTMVSVVVLGTMERLAHARAQAEAAQRQAAENQLRLLQSQLEPHMLFNTLANLRVLIGLDPARAQAMLDRLISFLRATLSASRSAAHPLATEFQHLDDYLSLMAIRMGPRLQVQLDLPTELRALPVPPLLLQPLVENAIQHGLEPKVDGGRIQVSARASAGLLTLQVRDTGVGLQAAPSSAGSAFGLEQVRTRLATLHGSRASLALQPAPDAEGGTLVTLQLPLP